MSHIISNSYVESDMTDRFLCWLYRDERNYQEVLANGMDPIEIWKNLKYKAYGKQVEPIIIDRLIFNNVRRGFMVFHKDTRRVSLTDIGRVWAADNCNRF